MLAAPAADALGIGTFDRDGLFGGSTVDSGALVDATTVAPPLVTAVSTVSAPVLTSLTTLPPSATPTGAGSVSLSLSNPGGAVEIRTGTLELEPEPGPSPVVVSAIGLDPPVLTPPADFLGLRLLDRTPTGFFQSSGSVFTVSGTPFLGLSSVVFAGNVPPSSAGSLLPISGELRLSGVGRVGNSLGLSGGGGVFQIPEPSTNLLMIAGLIALLRRR